MKIRNGDTDIKLPELVKVGDQITARWANSILGALQRLRDRQPVLTGGQAISIPKPFEVTLGADGENYYVVVSAGKICERQMAAGLAEDALFFHVCDNQFDISGTPEKFTIEVGEAIFVNILEDDYGAIKPGEDITLVIDDKDKMSTNYIPGPTAQAGSYFYKLAELEEYEGSVRLVNYLAGSHIYHQTGLTADLVIRDCPVYPETNETAPILLRASFVSGMLVSVGETEAARSMAETLEENNLVHCS
ncbi:MAG: hypothetical protein ACK48S_03265 [Planctomycetia bacterium]